MGAASAYAKEAGVDTSQVFIWLDFSCVDQDNDADLVRGVNSLGCVVRGLSQRHPPVTDPPSELTHSLYVASADAFVTIEHPVSGRVTAPAHLGANAPRHFSTPTPSRRRTSTAGGA